MTRGKISAGFYVHIPFCDHKCIYCDFYSIINYNDVKNYLSALKKEIAFYKTYCEEYFFDSIYFGGGTPSFMSPDYIAEIIETIRANFLVSEKAEITLEANPGTVAKEKLAAFKSAGVNRLSVGIQSFDEDELKFLTRIHDKATAIKTIEDAANLGFENISLDLIFNLPAQTKERWKNNLSIATQLPVKHISAYSLILERGTILNKMVLDGKIKMQSEDYDADLYQYTIEELDKCGFAQYEVSNFAKENYECLHNKFYWNGEEYLGIGTSAHSFIKRKRWWNFSSLTFYLLNVNEKQNGEAGFEIISDEKYLEEYILLSLRSSGINKKKIQSLAGYDWIESKISIFNKLKAEGFLRDERDKIILTAKGFAVCDEIISMLI